MELIVLNLLLSCILVVQPFQSIEAKSNALCPDTSDASLMTTVVSGCKVHYTCKNGKVKNVFQCSESQLLAGATQVCQENPQCPGIDSIKESLNLLTNVDESENSDSDQSAPLVKDESENLGITFMDKIMRFIKCLVDTDNFDDFSKTCIDSTLFQKRPFMEIELSPNVFEVYAKMLNKSKTPEDEKYDQTWDTSLGKVLNGLVRYLAPQCEVVCSDASKQPEDGASDLPDDKPLISIEDPNLSSEDVPEPDQELVGDRVRRSPMTNLLMSIFLNSGRQVFIPPVYPPIMPTVTIDTRPKLNDNSTLMSDVIVPIIQDIVNDEEALKNTTNFVRVVFEAVVPLATEILKASNESFDPEQKAILKIPREMVQSTIRKIHAEGYPILKSILGSKLQSVLMLLSKNSRLLFRSWDQMQARLDSNMKELLSKGMELYKKYYSMFRSSTKDFIHMYSLLEVQQDIESMYSLLPEVSKDLLIKNWSVFQDASGITTENISRMLLDVPGIFEAINAIPLEHYVYFFFLFL